jgi:multidrug efflux pump subunit AcrA (membrane-fusion protein)
MHETGAHETGAHETGAHETRAHETGAAETTPRSPNRRSLAATLLIAGPGRAPVLVYAIAGFVGLAALWASKTPVDVFVRAPGVVRPEGEVVRIVSEAAGRIAFVDAGEGDDVEAGQILAGLETGEVELRRVHLTRQIELRQSQLDHLETRMRDLETVHRAEVSRIDAEIRSGRQKLLEAEAEFASRLEAARIQRERARGEHTTSTALRAEGLISEDAWAEGEARLRLAHLEYARTRSSPPERSGIEVLDRSRDLAGARFDADRTEVLGAIYPIRLELGTLALELEGAMEEAARRTIRSPGRGRLTLVENIHKGERLGVGDVIGALEPARSARVVEAVVANNDAEQVEPGLPVRLVLDRDRILDGVVRSVSPDIRPGEPSGGTYRVVITPEVPGLRLGLGLEVRIITRTDSALGLLVNRIRRSFGEIGG